MCIKTESIVFVLIASILLACSAAGAAQVSSTSAPVCFIKNMGQTDEQVLYFADAAGYAVYLTLNGEVISTADPATAVWIVYPGGSNGVVVTGGDELQGKANFLIGNDQDSWVTDVPLFSSVEYESLFPGVDLVYHSGISSLKKEFVLRPGADPLNIRMQYSGQDGLALDENGALLITTAAGTFFESAPYCYQIVDGQEVTVPCGFIIGEEGSVSFDVGAYDPALPLIIDPVYYFSTYLGGTQDDKGTGVGMDDDGNVYVVGSTQSTQFPLSNNPAYQEHLNGSWDIFASKFSSDGSQLLYSTYIGGKKDDLAGGMVVNNDTGVVTFTGSTKSTDYPNSYPYPPLQYGGNTDAVVTRLNADGDGLIWSRLINGNKTDVGTAVTLDDYSNDDAVVTGYTSSTNLTAIGWVTTGQTSLMGATDGFVVIITSGGTLARGTYLGSPNYDYAYGIAVDPANNYDVWVTGSTNSYNSFPTSPSAFRKQSRGATDAFISRLNWGDLSVGASTYLGSSADDVGMGIDYDSNGYPYVTGYTGSPISPISLFPVTPNPMGFQTSFGGGQWDAFVTKMERDLSSMNYSTYLGGNDDDKAYGIAVDANGTAFVTGWTMSTNFPVKCPTQATKGVGFRIPDAFITQMNQTGTGVLFSTYLGGTYLDEGDAIAITDDGLNITVTGFTESINFPIKDAYQPYLAGFPAVRFTDAFVTKILKVPPVANISANPLKGCSPAQIMFEDNSTNNPDSWYWEFDDNTTSTEQNPSHTFYNNGTMAKDFIVNLTASNCDGSNTTSLIIKICPNLWYNLIANQSARGCVGANDTLKFDGVYVSGDPAITDWWFDFGDNTSVPHMVQVHQFTNTSDYNVTLWVQNECCNNSTMITVDIREKPAADFFAIPTSGLIPLDVNFFDNSTGRPSNWTWTFGAGEGGSTEQNPEHTYSSKGAYKVKLIACNFCGCDTETKNAYIQAGIPNLSFAPGSLVVPTNDTTPIDLYLQEAENGLSGYDLDVFWTDSVHGDINAVHFPLWAANKSHTPLPDYIVGIKAVDMSNQVNPGATNVLLATFDLEGNISTFMSTIEFNVSVNELDDDFGNPIYTNNVPATITVVRLLPFPNKTRPPTDPFDDQIYWDVNGNGRIDFNDVTTYFQNMQWIRDNQYEPFFDYNGNGYIDFADLILLFNMVPYP